MQLLPASEDHRGLASCSIFVAGMMLIVGELSAFYLLSAAGFVVVVLLGIVLASGGFLYSR